MPITYLEFALGCVVVPGAGLAIILVRTGRWHPAQIVGTVLLSVVALLYTVPWDAYLIRSGVWTYGSVLVGQLGVVPYEELLFVASQAIMTGLWTALVVDPDGRGPGVSRRQRLFGGVAGLAVSLTGLLAVGTPSLQYLGAILAWAGPVLALQWGFGWPVLVRRRRAILLALSVPTGYLWLADRLAIELGLWSFSTTQTTGVTMLGLPIEEALFFLTTNVFLVQGLVLFGWVVERGLLPSSTETLRNNPDHVE